MKLSRLNLHAVLESIIGNENVYFQPPTSTRIKYPCIIYNLAGIPKKYADNKSYIKHYEYTVTYIDQNPDNDIVDKLSDLQYTELTKSFATQGLYHYVYSINFKNEIKENN